MLGTLWKVVPACVDRRFQPSAEREIEKDSGARRRGRGESTQLGTVASRRPSETFHHNRENGGVLDAATGSRRPFGTWVRIGGHERLELPISISAHDVAQQKSPNSPTKST